MDSLTPIKAADHYALICKAAKAIHTKAAEELSVKHIIQKCGEGKAFAFTSKQSDTLVILEPIADEQITVNVWIAYSEQGNAIKRYEQEIERLARLIGAKRLTFGSKRKGYKRAMPHWASNKNQYERHLT